MSKFWFRLEAVLAAGLLRILRKTLRFDVRGQNPPDQRCVYIFWHRNLLLMGLHRMGTRAAVLISASKDGELIAGPLSRLGYVPVRGSSSRQGAQALKEIIRLSREMTVALTPDGPKGPVGTIHPGVFQIAMLAKVPIIIMVAETKREWVFNSWDRFRFPKPFARVLVQYSEPILLDNKDDIPEVEQRIRTFMQKTEDKLKRELQS